MSAIGIDFGNDNCYVAVVRSGGIETVTNDYSQRATPAYVAFGPTCRDLGTSAKNKFITNLKNTVSSFKRLIGKKFRDPTLQYELSYLPYSVHELPNGSVGVKVSYLGNEAIFTVPQVAAMLITKLKDIAETALGNKVTDCVISVPIFFTDADRRSMLDVCRIAGLNVLRLLNETAAVALAYGFYKQDLSEEKPKKVVFVDIGHSAVQASLCDFYHGRLKVLYSTWDYCLGGRDIDNCMVRYFSQQFSEKYQLDVLSNNRAIVRLLQECEKLKKQLSANPQVLPLNIECFMEDKDVSSSLGRDKLEELCADILNRIENVFKRLILESNVQYGDISAVELVGGTSRMPAVKSLIKKVFRIEPSTTLNLDEAVARGCAIQAAMLSPALKTREFHMLDVQPFTIKLAWSISRNERGDIEAFPRNHPVPFSKLLTFFRKEEFVLEAYYTVGREKNVPDILIGSFTIKNVNQLPSGESAKIIVKLRVNIHGIFNIYSAIIVDKDFKESMILDQANEDLMDMQFKKPDVPIENVINEEKKRDFFSLKRHKKVSAGIELQIESKVPHLSESELKTYIESEQKMILQDKSEEKRINAKNSVEEYIYEMRGRLSDELREYTDQDEFDNFTDMLSRSENWLYEDGQDQNEAVYKDKLQELKAMADPILRRKSESDRRPSIIQDFHHAIEEIQNILSAYLNGDEKYSHIDAKDMERVQRIVDENLNWLQTQLDDLKDLQQYQNPPILVEHLYAQKEKLKEEIYSILSKPKPKCPEDKTAKKDNEVKC